MRDSGNYSPVISTLSKFPVSGVPNPGNVKIHGIQLQNFQSAMGNSGNSGTEVLKVAKIGNLWLNLLQFS